METISVCGQTYTVLRLLGKGKSGYSYLVQDETDRYVVKQIHHEPCDYYHFGDKLKAELHAYRRLRALDIPMPALLRVDAENERILKEYIEGETIEDCVKAKRMQPSYPAQIRQMCERLYPAGLNIDYYPTNFVVRGGRLYYVDYECNDYMDEWNFENWGAQYWQE